MGEGDAGRGWGHRSLALGRAGAGDDGSGRGVASWGHGMTRTPTRQGTVSWGPCRELLATGTTEGGARRPCRKAKGSQTPRTGRPFTPSGRPLSYTRATLALLASLLLLPTSSLLHSTTPPPDRCGRGRRCSRGQPHAVSLTAPTPSGSRACQRTGARAGAARTRGRPARVPHGRSSRSRR